MNDKMWEEFFDAIGAIVSGPGPATWQERAQALKDKAKEFDMSTELYEIAYWLND